MSRATQCPAPARGSGQPIALLSLEEKGKMLSLNLVVTLIVVGLVLYLINTYIPMASSIKAILNVVVIVVLFIWIVRAAGLWGSVVGLWMTP
jgi:predicted membrane protein